MTNIVIDNMDFLAILNKKGSKLPADKKPDRRAYQAILKDSQLGPVLTKCIAANKTVKKGGRRH